MITQFEKFLNENTSHGTPLIHYFNKNSLRHENIIGKKVIDITDGTTWFIKDIDPIKDDSRLPYQIFCTNKQNSEFGNYIDTRNLVVPDDVDFLQSQVQESFDAQELLNQIGGRKALYMMGVTKRLQLISDKDNLVIRPSVKNRKGINYIKITLLPDDLYDIEFGRIRKVKVGMDFDKSPFSYTVIDKYDSVYAEDLAKTIENTMEIRLKLF